MDKKILKLVKDKYENGENLIDYLKSTDGRQINTFEDIMISYDFQAGTYVDDYMKNKKASGYIDYYKKISVYIKKYMERCNYPISILDAGCGEATTLGEICDLIGRDKFTNIYGLDASFSRLLVAQKFLKNEFNNESVKLVMGNMLNLPFKENSCDIVFTVHACEPNGGKEKILVEELLRVTKHYLILFEPAYDLADQEAKERMKKLGYVTGLYNVIESMGLKIKEHRLLGINRNKLNPTGVIVVEKKPFDKGKKIVNTSCLADPVSKQSLKQKNNILWCEESMLIYPIMDSIYCLNEDNAVIATKYE